MDMNITPDVKRTSRITEHYPGCSRDLLCRCKYFKVERIQVMKAFSFPFLERIVLGHYVSKR